MSPYGLPTRIICAPVPAYFNDCSIASSEPTHSNTISNNSEFD